MDAVLNRRNTQQRIASHSEERNIKSEEKRRERGRERKSEQKAGK